MTYPLNIFIVLTDVIVWQNTKADWINNEIDFLRKYRIEISKTHPNDFLLILTNRKFEKKTFDTYINQSCTNDKAVAWVDFAYKNFSRTVIRIYESIAQNIHANHKCHTGNENGNDFKICKENIHQQIAIHNNSRTKCYANVPMKLFKSPTCGNEFIENGEECDCGSNEKCPVKCNIKTCKFKCPQNCNEHGKCDKNGKCHCKIGFILPKCEQFQFNNDGALIATACILAVMIILVIIGFIYFFYRRSHSYEQLE